MQDTKEGSATQWEWKWEGMDGAEPLFVATHSVDAVTKETSFANMNWFGDESKRFLALDTPGHNDTSGRNLEEQSSRDVLREQAADLHNKLNAKKKAKAKAAHSAAQLADGSAPALEPEPAPASSPSASTPLDPAKEIKKLNKKLRQIDDLKVRLPQSPHESCKLAFTHACSACQRRKRWPQE